MVMSRIFPRRSSTPFRWLMLTPALTLIVLTCWALASPVGASPDDDFHLASTWCGLGERASACEATSDPATREVPKEVTHSAICYAYKPDQSAACQEDFSQYAEAPLVETPRGNFEGLYPPVFYAVDGLFVSPDVGASVIAMRVFNSLLFVVLATATFLLLPARRKPLLIWGWVISLIPLGIFIIPSNNPSGWAVISAGTLWIALVGFFETQGKSKIGLAIIALVATVVGAGARADAAMYAVLAAVVAVILTAKTNKSYLISLWLPLAVVAVSIGFYLSAGQGPAAAAGMSANAPGASVDTLVLVAWNTLNMPLLWAGVFGSWGLGWLDTNLPGIVSVGALAAFIAVGFSGLASRSWRKSVALGVLVFALWALPSYVLWQAGVVVGAEVQPRYLLPMIVILGGVMLFQVDRRSQSFSRIQRILVTVAIAAAHSVALYFNIRRYVTGMDVRNWNLDAGIEWWWPIFVSPMTVWLLGTAVFTMVVWILVREATNRMSESSVAGERVVSSSI